MNWLINLDSTGLPWKPGSDGEGSPNVFWRAVGKIFPWFLSISGVLLMAQVDQVNRETALAEARERLSATVRNSSFDFRKHEGRLPYLTSAPPPESAVLAAHRLRKEILSASPPPNATRESIEKFDAGRIEQLRKLDAGIAAVSDADRLAHFRDFGFRSSGDSDSALEVSLRRFGIEPLERTSTTRTILLRSLLALGGFSLLIGVVGVVSLISRFLSKWRISPFDWLRHRIDEIFKNKSPFATDLFKALVAFSGIALVAASQQQGLSASSAQTPDAKLNVSQKSDVSGVIHHEGTISMAGTLALPPPDARTGQPPPTTPIPPINLTAAFSPPELRVDVTRAFPPDDSAKRIEELKTEVHILRHDLEEISIRTASLERPKTATSSPLPVRIRTIESDRHRYNREVSRARASIWRRIGWFFTGEPADQELEAKHRNLTTEWLDVDEKPLAEQAVRAGGTAAVAPPADPASAAAPPPDGASATRAASSPEPGSASLASNSD